MVVVLMGRSCDLELLIMAFESVEQGKQYIEKALGRTGVLNEEVNYCWYDVDKELENEYNESDDEWVESKTAQMFFTEYYDGCGCVDTLILRTIPYAKPVIAFSLD